MVNEKFSKIVTVGIFAMIFFMGAIALFHICCKLSFVHPLFNVWIFVGTLLTPGIIFLLLPFSRLWTPLKIIGCCITLPLALLCLLGIIFILPEASESLNTCINPAYTLLKSIALGATRIAVYRTNGGATTDFGVVVERQRFPFPGIKCVEPVANAYHVSDAELTFLDEHHIRCHIPVSRDYKDYEVKDVIIADE